MTDRPDPMALAMLSHQDMEDLADLPQLRSLTDVGLVPGLCLRELAPLVPVSEAPVPLTGVSPFESVRGAVKTADN
jgi:hypothetical protein